MNVKFDEEFLKQFRWITPLAVSATGIAVMILIAVVNNLTNEIRAVRVEVTETRKFAVQYTNTMIDLIIKTSEKKK